MVLCNGGNGMLLRERERERDRERLKVTGKVMGNSQYGEWPYIYRRR